MSYRHSSLQQDLLLKRYVDESEGAQPGFNWGEALDEGELAGSRGVVRLSTPQGERDLVFADVANAIGKALTSLILVQSETEKNEAKVFTSENREFVARITREVASHLEKFFDSGEAARLSLQDLNLHIEKALVENNAYDVARSFVFHNASHLTSQRSEVVDLRVIRRNTQVVPWNPDKIEIAVRKAFLSQQMDSSPAVEVAEKVTEAIVATGQSFIHIEEVQDLVQEILMKLGHYKVAEAYILYRAERAIMRQVEREQSPETATESEGQTSMVVVTREDGSTFLWDGADLVARVRFAAIDLELCLSEEEIITELRRSIFDEITTEDLKMTIILNAKALIEKDADFACFAGRILCSYIYEEVLGWDIMEDGIGGLKELHQRYLSQYIEKGIAIDRLSPELKKYDIAKLSRLLDPSADLYFDYLGIQTLYDRYLLVDKRKGVGRRIETPQIFWLRVAMGLCLNEGEAKEDRAAALYDLYKSRRFCSSTPTLFNSATLHSQLSSCYLYWVDDSIESIMQRGIAENAYLSKWAGGLGGSWTAVRGTGSHIAGTNGESQGVIPFLKLHNDQLIAVNQGGKRRGSGCAYLECWHNDLFEFLELRRNTGDDRRRTHDMNTANWIPDLFMKRMESREDWTLFRSSETPDLHELYGKAFEARYIEYEAMASRGEIKAETMPAIEVWKKMLQMLFETGHPWITFKDACNIRSPQDHFGVIHSSNLCTEITLNTGKEETAVCNLGSIVLDNHLDENGALDHDKLKETIRIAVRALDNVIDLNFYPTVPAQTSNLRHRPVGLGVMGLQNTLYQKGLAFDSPEAIDFNDEFMEAIAYYAFEASSDLAAERGSYSTYEGSKWARGILPQDSLELLEEERGVPIDVPRGSRMDWETLRDKIKQQGMRNSNVLAIAPTATISNIMGSSPCIEPHYKNVFVKSNLSGEFTVLNKHLVRDLKREGLWDQEMIDNLKYFDGELEDIPGIPENIKILYKTAFSIPYEAFIAAAARRQKWIDQSQSLNLFLGEPDMKTMSHMYRAAWRSGLKTTYYLRTMAATNIEKATVSVKKEVKDVIKGEYSDEEKEACSIEAMENGEECEACQ